MIDAEGRYNGKVSVAHYRRGLSAFRTVKELLNEGRIGAVRTVLLRTLQAPPAKTNSQSEDNWRLIPDISGGGIFHDLSPHQLDILYWIFGKPVSMSGYSVNQSKVYNAPDVTMLQAVFEKDVCLSGMWAFNVAPHAVDERCEIIGDKGKIQFSFFKLGDVELTTESGTEILPMEYPLNVQFHMIDAVTKYFRGEGENPCSLDEALEVMKMMESV
jgi:predicted dehydrogenase